MDKINKVINFEIKQIGEESDRVLRFVGSDETPDRDNDIIEVAGWKLEEYIKNPVFLWAHQYDQPPVGKAVNVTIDASTKKLLFDIKFPTAEEYPFADTIYRLYKGGYLQATSVGFQGIKHKTRDEEEVLNLPEWRRGRRYLEQKLLELSGVPVPSNPNALMMAKSAGIEIDVVEKAIKDNETKEVEYLEEEGLIKIYNAETKTESCFTVETLKNLDANKIDLYKQHSESISKLNNFMSENKLGEPGVDSVDEAIKILTEKLDIKEIKQSLEDIKSLVLLLSQKNDANKVFIDLDAIEYKAEKVADKDELSIEPEQLKNLIKETIKEELEKGGF